MVAEILSVSTLIVLLTLRLMFRRVTSGCTCLLEAGSNPQCPKHGGG